MSKIFDLNNPVMRFLSGIADLMILNVVVTICCIPIITIGASMTAMHYVLLKMARNEEGYIIKDFFKSFKQNFKQATIIWLIMLVFILVFIGEYFIVMYSGIEFPKEMSVVLIVAASLLFIISTYIFPVLSRFDNTIKQTIKNGCLMSIMAAPYCYGGVSCSTDFGHIIFPGITPTGIIFGYYGSGIFECKTLFRNIS